MSRVAMQPSDQMVDAYLVAQRRVIEDVDRLWGCRGGKAATHLQPVRDACRAGLAAAFAAGREELAKPDQPKQGWKLVPIDPTPTMKTAGINVDVYSDGVDGNVLNWAEAEAVYNLIVY